MAAPTYASDLTDILTDMASTTGWTALGGGASGLVAPETDFFIQGSNCISKAGWSTATKGMIFGNASGITVPSGKAVYIWIYFWASNSTAVEASGGIQALIGSSATAFKQWYIRGSDTLVYGGWVCGVVDPTITADATTGSPTATLQFFGAQANVPAAGPSKGQPLGIDAFRYGRDYTCTNGDLANGYATFAGAALFNDNSARRYGQFQGIDGGYLMQCRFLFGSAATAVDFRDSNRNILIARTTKVSSSFNRFEVVNASSNIALTNISVAALGTTSRGDWVTTDNATVNLSSCSFTDMGTFGFASNTTATSTTFRRCQLITQNSATFSSCIFDSTADSSRAILANNLSNIATCKFISGGTGHGIELTTAGTYTFSANTFTGYGSNNTTNAAIYNNATPTTVVSYSETNQDALTSLNSGGTVGAGQSFAGNGGVLSACRFYLKKTGSPTGNAVCKIYAHSGTFGTSSIPTGAALATSDNFDVSTLTTSLALTEFKFTGSNNITLTNATNYILTIEYSGGSAGNSLDVGRDASSPTASGNFSTYNGTTWTAVSGSDACFYLYTGGALILNITNNGGTPTYRNALGCSTTINNAVSLQVVVKNSTGTAIQSARVAIYKVSDNSEITNTLTNISGIVSSSYAYTVDEPIYIRVRKSSTGTTRYINNDSSGTILSTGFSATVNLLTDTTASP